MLYETGRRFTRFSNQFADPVAQHEIAKWRPACLLPTDATFTIQQHEGWSAIHVKAIGDFTTAVAHLEPPDRVHADISAPCLLVLVSADADDRYIV